MLLLESGNFDLAYCSYYMDIAPRISFMFDQDGAGNFGSVRSDDIDVAIDAFEAAITDEEILEACSALQRTLAERVPQIGLYFKTDSIICDESVMGITNQRQNRAFTDIAQWYIGFYTETPQAPGGTEETIESEAVETEEAEIIESAAYAGAEAEATETG
jgi:ABC-type oligopeptide transport system substrate-binding subunit